VHVAGGVKVVLIAKMLLGNSGSAEEAELLCVSVGALDVGRDMKTRNSCLP
jgi:hypothetical protein